MSKNEITHTQTTKETKVLSEEFKYLPLGSLLPELSSLLELKSSKEVFSQRLEVLQQHGLHSNEDQAEINMLQQVIQWLEIQS